MCGITGVLELAGSSVELKTLSVMNQTLAHRGPDGEGSFIDGPCGLAHRRLAIIDLSPSGHQPMLSQSGRFAISYNGEIYNFRELRKELEVLGHRFRSTSDTEVVLTAWEQWGDAAIVRFNGMFAFALWDRKYRELTLARDRYGIKPMYYSERNGHLVFGSEIKAVMAHPEMRAEVDQEALLEYLTFQNYFTDRTLFAGVRLQPAGTILKACQQNGFWRLGTPTPYWDFDFREPDCSVDKREYVEELDRLFRQAVRRQLVSDVEIGSYLSGGVDSGSITALAASAFPYLKSFTCGFDLSSASGLELAFDERAKAERLSYLFKTEHYEMVLKAGDMERAMPKLVYHLEEPRVGQSYPNFYVAQLASKFVKVALAGTGGDELFGGYPWRYYRAVVNDDFEQYVDKYYGFWQRLIPNATAQHLFRPIWHSLKHVSTRDIFRGVFTKHAEKLTRAADYVNHSLYLEAKTFLHGLLVMEDKLSMAHGLETRIPFLDNDLVDFAMNVPASLKLGNLSAIASQDENEPGPKTEKYFARAHDGKLLLREVMTRHVPADIAHDAKQGFSAPDASWFKGESLEYVRRVVFNASARIYEFLDPKVTRQLVDDHLGGRQNRRLLIWSLLSLEQALTEFF